MAGNKHEPTKVHGTRPSLASIAIGILTGTVISGAIYIDGYWNLLFLLLTWISFTITGLLFPHVGSKLSESKFTTPVIIFIILGSQAVFFSTIPLPENVAISISVLILGISSATMLIGVLIGSVE